MRAVRLHARRDIRVEEIPEPAGPLGPTDVLLQIRACGICGTDLREYTSGPKETPADRHPLTGAQLPQILGHEVSAEVLAVGRGVTRVRPGDRVAVMPVVWCGACYQCGSGLEQMCQVVAGIGLSCEWGGLAEKAVVHERNAVRVPDALTFVEAALIEPTACAVNAVERGGVKAGDRVLVTGAGSVGGLSVLAARAAGAGTIIVSEPNSARAVSAARLGADFIVDPVASDVGDAVRDLTDGHGADVAMECSGADPALRACLAAVRNQGTVVQVGLHTMPVAINTSDLVEREVGLVGSYTYPIDSFPRIAERIANGRLPVGRVASSTLPFHQLDSKVFERLSLPTAFDAKVIVEM